MQTTGHFYDRLLILWCPTVSASAGPANRNSATRNYSNPGHFWRFFWAGHASNKKGHNTVLKSKGVRPSISSNSHPFRWIVNVLEYRMKLQCIVLYCACRNITYKILADEIIISKSALSSEEITTSDLAVSDSNCHHASWEWKESWEKKRCLRVRVIKLVLHRMSQQHHQTPPKRQSLSKVKSTGRVESYQRPPDVFVPRLNSR
jgi:hypothetical protein